MIYDGFNTQTLEVIHGAENLLSFSAVWTIDWFVIIYMDFVTTSDILPAIKTGWSLHYSTGCPKDRKK